MAAAHRALFLNGVFSYVSAVLWLGFLMASTTEAAIWAIRGPDYFDAGPALFPNWLVWRLERVQALFAVVALLMLLPKVLAVVLAVREGQVSSFGGAGALLRSVIFESAATALFAPIRMAFYCRFVVRSAGDPGSRSRPRDPLRCTLARLRRRGRRSAPQCRAHVAAAGVPLALRGRSRGASAAGGPRAPGRPDALSDREKRVLLSDAAALLGLHGRVWQLEDPEAAGRWGLAGEHLPRPRTAGC